MADCEKCGVKDGQKHLTWHAEELMLAEIDRLRKVLHEIATSHAGSTDMMAQARHALGMNCEGIFGECEPCGQK